MKRFLVMLLALAVLLSLSGVAFADNGVGNLIGKLKGGAKIDSNPFIEVDIDNSVQNADSGNAENEISSVNTDINIGESEAEAKDGCSPSADNVTKAKANVKVNQDAHTGEVDIWTAPNNTVDIVIDNWAEADADCEVTADKDHKCGKCSKCKKRGNGPSNIDSEGFCKTCGCLENACKCDVPSAKIISNPFINVDIDNSLQNIRSGNASNNISSVNTNINIGESEAEGKDGGDATNATIAVANVDISQHAKTGDVKVTNVSNNNVSISLINTAIASKSLDVAVSS